MHRTLILGVRLTVPERERVNDLAQRAARTPSAFVRLLLLGVDPESVGPGIPPPPLPEPLDSERETGPAITEAKSRREAVLA